MSLVCQDCQGDDAGAASCTELYLGWGYWGVVGVGCILGLAYPGFGTFLLTGVGTDQVPNDAENHCPGSLTVAVQFGTAGQSCDVWEHLF